MKYTTYKDSHKSPLKKLGLRYIASIALSGGIGVLTGSLIRYAEKQLRIEASPYSLFLLLLGWCLESELREEMVIALEKDYIGYKKGLMLRTAQLASWIAYLSDYME
jgi:hypothetical protein